MSESVWRKPVICIFKERQAPPETDPFVVIKAKQVTLTGGKDPKYRGAIKDFFTLMGDADYLSSDEGKTDHYVMCWFDDTQPDMTRDLRRLRGVRFNGSITCTVSGKNHKRTYNAAFNAEQAKLN